MKQKNTETEKILKRNKENKTCKQINSNLNDMRK